MTGMAIRDFEMRSPSLRSHGYGGATYLRSSDPPLSLKVTAGTYLRATPDQSEGQYYLRELFDLGRV